MPFEKAKRTLDKATPGINEIESVLAFFGDMEYHEGRTKSEIIARNSEALNQAQIVREDIHRLQDKNAVTDHNSKIALEIWGEIISYIMTGEWETAYDRLPEFAMQVPKIESDISRYCRAPNAVGLGRTVTE